MALKETALREIGHPVSSLYSGLHAHTDGGSPPVAGWVAQEGAKSFSKVFSFTETFSF